MRAFALLLALTQLPAAAAQAQTEQPTIVSATQTDGRITVKWELPSDEWENDLVELGKSDDTSGFEGGFRDRDVVDVIPPRDAQRQVTFFKVRPGTYYVHVSMLRKRCQDVNDDSCVEPTWSDVKKVVVPESVEPKRYRGETSQGRNVGFIVDNRRVINFKIGYFAPCRFGNQRGSGLTRRIRLRSDRTFRKRIRVRFDDGSTARVRIRGRLRGKRRARGTFRYTSRG